MDQLIWIVVALIALLGLIAVIVVRSKEKVQPNYRAFFIIGLSWIPLGIATKNPAFTALGVVFMVLGLKNRDKWKDRVKFSELPSRLKWTKAIVIGTFVLLTIIVFIYYFFYTV